MSDFVVKAMYKVELANAYGISIRMIKEWIDMLPKEVSKSAKIRDGKCMLTPNQVEILVKHWGNP